MDYMIVTNPRPPRTLLTPNTPEQDLIQGLRSGLDVARLCQLLTQVSDVNARADGFWTPLTLAAFLGRQEFVEHLLNRDSEISENEENYISCLSFSESQFESETCCLRKIDKQDSSKTTTTERNVKDGVLSKEDSILDCANDAEFSKGLQNQIRSSSCPLVTFALQKESRSAHATKIKQCRINECNDNGESPLICAVRANCLPICELLLKYGADVNQQSHNGRHSPLHIALENKCSDIVDLLLSHEADVQVCDNVGITPLYIAMKTREDKLVRKLIEAGCDVNLGSQDHAPIFLAARLGLLGVCKLLCEAGCNVNVQNKYGVTPVYEAALKGHLHVLEYLLNQGCSVNHLDMYGVSALHVAAMAGNVPIICMLAQARGNLKARDKDGLCPVHRAVEGDHAPAVSALLHLGVDITHPAPSPSRLKWWQSDSRTIIVSGCTSLPLPSPTDLALLTRICPSFLKMLLLSGIQGASELVQQLLEHVPINLELEDQSFIAQFYQHPQTLKSIVRMVIRQCLGNKVLFLVPKLPIPSSLQDYLTMKEFDNL